MFEKPISQEQVSNFEKINNLLRDISEKYRKEGVPVDNNCRVDISKLSNYYSEEILAKDLGKIRNIRERILIEEEGKSKENKEGKEKKGERLEKLKTITFNKFLGESAICVRSSEYDDIINGVDNILVDRQTGKIICAFDEVCDINREIFQKKKEKILEKNREGGAKLKYCPKIENGKISFGRVENIPIFYIALSEEILNEAEKQISHFLKETSDWEEKLFSYFWNSLYNQAQLLYLDRKVNPEILNNLSFFEKIPPPRYTRYR